MARNWLPALALWMGFLGTAAASGPARGPRREVLDRHGHPIAHLPPLNRDAACAPDLPGLVARRGAGEEASGAIATRIDGALQALAQQVVQRGVERLARVPGKAVPGRAAGRVEPGQQRVGTISAVSDAELRLELAPGTEALLPLPPLPSCPGHADLKGSVPPPAPRFRRGERLSVRVLSLGADGRALVALQPQAALVALDPGSRDVLALVGGYGQRPYDFDRATQGRRQAGSTWKPLVFAAALAAGRHAPADLVEDLPRLYGGWRPRNFSGTYQGPMRLRAALAHSVNTVAVRLLWEVGPSRVADLAERLGIPRQQVPLDLTQALGTALVSPLQLAGAYATFADMHGGRYLPPRVFDRDRDSDRGPKALGSALAYVMSSLLSSVISEGSATRARELGIPGLCGKTGTTTQGHDAWFAGYSADLLAVVWVGDDEGPTPEAGQRTGADTALPIWMDFMRGALAVPGYGAPRPGPWPRPPGVTEVALPEGGTELALPLALPDTP